VRASEENPGSVAAASLLPQQLKLCVPRFTRGWGQLAWKRYNELFNLVEKTTGAPPPGVPSLSEARANIVSELREELKSAPPRSSESVKGMIARWIRDNGFEADFQGFDAK
jgi:hypothetical protein